MADSPTSALLPHILVALDESPESQNLLVVASHLATCTGARLTGLYVEDTLLLELARSPLARELGSFTGSVRTLAYPDLERRFRTQATSVQRRLLEAAEGTGVRSSFRIMRGRVVRELVTVAESGELLVLGRGRHRRRLGSAAEGLVDEARGPLLLIGQGQRIGDRVLVVHEERRHEKAVRLAADLASGLGSALEILTVDGDADRAEHLRELVGRSVASLRIHTAGELDPETVLRELAPGPGDLLVVPVDGRLSSESARSLIERAAGPVLLYR